MTERINTPILFIIFKRDYTAIEVFKKIREMQPKKMYISADGPRNPEEKLRCEKTREIIKLVDWECDLHLQFRDENLGCKYGPYTSISWFFEHEEAGIILEDDCVPDLTFFPFAAAMLEKYRDDDRVGMIAGHTEVNIPLKTSYIFSRFKACWGWATWRRAWRCMDIELQTHNYEQDVIPLMVYDQQRARHWHTALELIARKEVTAWDWPWYFSLAAQSQLCIFPCKNLIANIGFGKEGTHCLGEAPIEAITSYSLTFPLIEPKSVIVDWDFEKEFEKGLTMGIPQPEPRKKKKNIFSRTFKKLKGTIKRLVNKHG